MSKRFPLWATSTPMGVDETDSSSLSVIKSINDAPTSSNSRALLTSLFFMPVSCVINSGMDRGGLTSS